MKIENLVVIENQLYNVSNSLKDFKISIGNEPNIAFFGFEEKTGRMYTQWKNGDNSLVESNGDDDYNLIYTNDTDDNYQGNYFIEKVNLSDLVLEFNELLNFRNGLNLNTIKNIEQVDSTHTNYLI